MNDYTSNEARFPQIELPNEHIRNVTNLLFHKKGNDRKNLEIQQVKIHSEKIPLVKRENYENSICIRQVIQAGSERLNVSLSHFRFRCLTVPVDGVVLKKC